VSHHSLAQAQSLLGPCPPVQVQGPGRVPGQARVPRWARPRSRVPGQAQIPSRTRHAPCPKRDPGPLGPNRAPFLEGRLGPFIGPLKRALTKCGSLSQAFRPKSQSLVRCSILPKALRKTLGPMGPIGPSRALKRPIAFTALYDPEHQMVTCERQTACDISGLDRSHLVKGTRVAKEATGSQRSSGLTKRPKEPKGPIRPKGPYGSL